MEKEKVETLFSGRVFEVVNHHYNFDNQKLVFENAIRSPGVRIIAINNGKLLLNREYRTELGGFDYRLPGGKVFDQLTDYKASQPNKLLKQAEQAAIKELKEETGWVSKRMDHYLTSRAGATVTWDLLYFTAHDLEESSQGQQLETGEVITTIWITIAELLSLVRKGEFQEYRSLGVIFKYLLENDLLN